MSLKPRSWSSKHLQVPLEDAKEEYWWFGGSSPDEEATPSDYDVGGLDLGAESPRSSASSINLLENYAYVKQWAESRAPRRRRSSSFTKERQRFSTTSQRDDDRECGICFEYAIRPCRTLCCGKIFCTEHLADWLHGPKAEGRCPNCENPCSLVGGTIPLSPSTLRQSPITRRTLYSTSVTSPLSVAHSHNDAFLTTAKSNSQSTNKSSKSTGVTFPISQSDDESITQLHRRHHLRLKSNLSQHGAASPSAISFSTTPFSQSWGAISRLMSIITFLMFIYKLLS